MKKDSIVLSLSFESADELFVSLYALAAGFIRKVARILKVQGISEKIVQDWQQSISREFPFDDLGQRITELCMNCGQDVILMIDEVDKSSDNQIFLSFLGLLREKYLEQMKGKDKTFRSVILASVYDIKNLKLKLHPGAEPKYNSPWNVAVDFNLDINLSPDEIASMLRDYEKDWNAGIDITWMSNILYEYTSGYPFLVSKLCQIMAQNGRTGWSQDGFQCAVRELLKAPNTLFDDMSKKLAEYPELKEMIQSILFQGKKYAYEAENHRISIGKMFGFLTEKQGMVSISNRIFETQLYNMFLSEEVSEGLGYRIPALDKNQFIKDGMLDMELVMTKFMVHFTDVYSDSTERFIEENGRRLFLLYLKPIINGTGNYYIEAQTRTQSRTDIIIDYLGRQFVVELKIWRGEEYNRKGERQLADYLEQYHLDKGYLLTFNFNKQKTVGAKEVWLGDKRIFEVIV